MANVCEKLLDTFSMFPDVTDHLIKNNGVTPILEMFDACFSRYERSSASASVSAGSGSKSTGSSRDNSSTQSFSSVVLADVLKVINKIMEGNGSSQEQLVTMGIIPQVRRALSRPLSRPLSILI